MNWQPDVFIAKDLVKLISSQKVQIPPYQRGQVWSQKKEEKFVDSIEKGFPFGSLLFYKSPDNNFHLIDGLQRSTTLFRYISNPTKYYAWKNVPENVTQNIFDLMAVVGEASVIKTEIAETISAWVKTHVNMEAISNMQYFGCATDLQKNFPNLRGKTEEIIAILTPTFLEYKTNCQQMLDARIPVIIYEGEAANLPEIFSRINSEGVPLNKYQILAASWSEKRITVDNDKDLTEILDAVCKFFSKLQRENFAIVDYDPVELMQRREVNLYQLIFGFGKLLRNKYPALFGTAASDSNGESCGFSLLNACFGNKNNELNKLRDSIETLKTDLRINQFLIQVLECCKFVDHVIGGYNKFKLNSRSNPSPLHTEFQVCSMVASVFLSRYSTIRVSSEDKKYTIYNGDSNPNWKVYRDQFTLKAFLHYFSDIINERWDAHGDTKLDEVIYTKDYYTTNILKENMEKDIQHWYEEHLKKKETANVPNPKQPEKLFLSIIYSNGMPAIDHLNTSVYDIEHLCPKKAMKDKLKAFEGKGLPVSAISNLCILPEWDNRQKRDKTIYQDKQYRERVAERLSEVEQKYTFTTESDLAWMDIQPDSYEKLVSDYMGFLNHRFTVLAEKILSLLYR